ncbi:MAG TPA: hypothetical protein VMU29_10950 [Smithella sp.]|nr:hypothetical protein [Smithella sp.]
MQNTNGHIPSRYEMNHLVRSVLTRHRANLELITVSCINRVVYLSGSLIKTTKPDYTMTEIDLIFRDIAKIPKVRSINADLDNWIVSAVEGTGEWLISQKGAAFRQQPQKTIRVTPDFKDDE